MKAEDYKQKEYERLVRREFQEGVTFTFRNHLFHVRLPNGLLFDFERRIHYNRTWVASILNNGYLMLGQIKFEDLHVLPLISDAAPFIASFPKRQNIWEKWHKLTPEYSMNKACVLLLLAKWRETGLPKGIVVLICKLVLASL